jgi:hypothetical protein
MPHHVEAIHWESFFMPTTTKADARSQQEAAHRRQALQEASEVTASWIVQRLGKHHDRAQFDCGNPRLNQWLTQRAGQFDRRDLARTYVAPQPQGHVVLGYYAVSSRAVRYEALPAEYCATRSLTSCVVKPDQRFHDTDTRGLGVQCTCASLPHSVNLGTGTTDVFTD